MSRWALKSKRSKRIAKVKTVRGSLEKRLAIVEQAVAQREQKCCTCGAPVLAMPGCAAGIRAQMNDTCPVHGFRELKIMHIVFVDSAPNSSGPEIIPDPEVDEVLNEYERRLAEAKKGRENV